MQTCARVLIEAEAALFEGSPLPSLVSGHLATCDTCRHEVSELTLLFGALGNTPTLVASPDLNATLTAAVLADVAAHKRKASIFTRVIRPFTYAAASFGVVLVFVVVSGTALLVGAAVRNGEPLSSQTVPTTAPATSAPATSTPVNPGASEAPASAAPTPTPAPTDLPRRTPEPASPTPSGVPSTDASGSTSP
ncbi:MAG: hypothetical protein RIR19_162 [Chloroflexota bacterium]|jgi:hypothetical protein